MIAERKRRKNLDDKAAKLESISKRQKKYDESMRVDIDIETAEVIFFSNQKESISFYLSLLQFGFLLKVRVTNI